MKDDTHSTSFVSMSKKWGVKFKVKKRLKLESWKIANKMLIFASIFKNSKLPKAHLSYESPHMFKFSLGLIQTAQSCSENERPQKKGRVRDLLIKCSFLLLFSKTLNCQKQIYHTNLPICLNFPYVSYGPHNTALKMNNP